MQIEGVWDFHNTTVTVQGEEVLRRDGPEYCRPEEITRLSCGQDRDEFTHPADPTGRILTVANPRSWVRGKVKPRNICASVRACVR